MLKSYALRRVGSAVFVVLGVVAGTFLLMHAVPGDPARTVLGEHANAGAVDQLRHQWGLDRPLGRQFLDYLDDVVHGRLGQSFFYNQSVGTIIGHRLGETAALVGGATLFAVLISVPLATLAAARRDRPADHLVRAFSVVALGMPAFWFGIVLIEVFAIQLHALPVGGWGTSTIDHIKSLVLPSLTAAIAIVPLLTRSLRVGMLEVLGADFVAAARAKGLSEARVLLTVVARNALIPTLTLLGLNIAFLIGSTVVVEHVFALNGLGSLLLDSITKRDFPAVQAVTLVLAVSVVVVNLATDLIAARLDPRIRLR